jgi:hypothetical protein
MKIKCLNCGEEFDGRADAKSCSDKCKKNLQRLKGTEGEELKGTFIKGDDPELIQRGQIISEMKLKELKGTNLPEVSTDEPCKVVSTKKDGEVYINLEKDLKLNLQKDLGVFAWTSDGILLDLR